MQYITDINAYQSEKKTAVTLGKFDCLHRGHQKLIGRVKELASEEIQSVVCAFDMGRNSLLTKEERKERLEQEVDCFIACPFTKEIREMEAEQFILQILAEKFHAAVVVVGEDFQFGHEKRGDVVMLEKYAAQCGYQLDVIKKEMYEGREISSTYVREALAEGNVTLANNLLGYLYGTEGVVEYGHQLGRTLGFPTMNITWDEHKIAPKFGVYACEIEIDDARYYGIGNVGIKPTVENEPHLLTEVYVFDYSGDTYGKYVKVWFHEFERPETKFASIDELKARVDKDILYGKNSFTK